MGEIDEMGQTEWVRLTKFVIFIFCNQIDKVGETDRMAKNNK